MPVYVCIRENHWGPTPEEYRLWKAGQEYVGTNPPGTYAMNRDGTRGEFIPNRHFMAREDVARLSAESLGISAAVDNRMTGDPRSDDQIRADIFEKYRVKVHPNAKRETLLAKELSLMKEETAREREHGSTHDSG